MNGCLGLRRALQDRSVKARHLGFVARGDHGADIVGKDRSGAAEEHIRRELRGRIGRVAQCVGSYQADSRPGPVVVVHRVIIGSTIPRGVASAPFIVARI